MTLVFECFDTVRFQVQEMARAEKIISDEAIQVELDIYNRLLPGHGGALGHRLHRADLRRGAAGVAAPAGGDRAPARHRDRRGGGGERARGRARRGPHPGDGHAGRPLRALRVQRGPGGGLCRRRRRWPWWPPIRPTRPGPSCHPGCAASSSGTCSAQQSPFQSADQGQFCAQVFTGAQDVRHTLRSPNLVSPPRVDRPKGPPNRANQVSAF